MTEPVDPGRPVGEPVEDGQDEAVRRLLQRLPEVTPPDGFFDELIRRRRRRARAVAGAALVAAAVAGAVVVAQATGITGEVSPPVSMLAGRHEDMTVPVGVARDAMVEDVPAPFQAPEEVGDMTRGFTLHHPDDVVQVVYGHDGRYLSVFEQAGELEDEAMDAGLTRIDVEGVAAWETDDGIVVVRRHDVVYVLVGDYERDDLTEIVDDLPDARPMGLTRRIGDAMDDLVDAFGLG